MSLVSSIEDSEIDMLRTLCLEAYIDLGDLPASRFYQRRTRMGVTTLLARAVEGCWYAWKNRFKELTWSYGRELDDKFVTDKQRRIIAELRSPTC